MPAVSRAKRAADKHLDNLKSAIDWRGRPMLASTVRNRTGARWCDPIGTDDETGRKTKVDGVHRRDRPSIRRTFNPLRRSYHDTQNVVRAGDGARPRPHPVARRGANASQ